MKKGINFRNHYRLVTKLYFKFMFEAILVRYNLDQGNDADFTEFQFKRYLRIAKDLYDVRFAISLFIDDKHFLMDFYKEKEKDLLDSLSDLEIDFDYYYNL